MKKHLLLFFFVLCTAIAKAQTPIVLVPPVNSSSCPNSSAVFSIVVLNATGYQWQVSTDHGANFNNIADGPQYSGSNTATLSVLNINETVSEYFFRAVITGMNSTIVTTNSVSIELLNPKITTQPSNQISCNGASVTFSVAGNLVNSYQWQLSTNQGLSWSNISGSAGTTTTLTISSPTVAMNGYQYRCVLSGLCVPAATSNAVTLTAGANTVYYEDNDGDGYGNPNVTMISCTGVPNGFVTNNLDCNDMNNTIYPGAPEICGDGIDNDCDGEIDEGCIPLTQISAVHHGTTIEYANTEYITIDPVVGADRYEVRITDGGAYTATAFDDLKAGAVRFIQFAGYEFGKTYQVSVRSRVRGEWSDYGSSYSVSLTSYPHSEIDPAQCGTTLPAINSKIYTKTVNGATQYRFRVINGSNVQTIDMPVRAFDLTQLPSFEYNTTYTIDVAVEFDGSWQNFSSACNVTTPALASSAVLPVQCGVTLSALTSSVFAKPVSGATTYRFRITNGSAVQSIDRATPDFKFTMLGSYAFSTTYSVEVSVEYGNVFQPYGSACNITTPGISTTQIQSTQCGITLPAMGTYFYANSVSAAEGYRFRLTEGSNVTVIENSTRAINFNMLAGRKAATTYGVEVAVKLNDTWGAYGPVCNLTTPAILTKIQSSQCGTVLPAVNKLIYADKVAEATAYRFRVTNGSNVQVIDRTSNAFYLTQLPTYSYGTSYTIEVAVEYSGIFQPYSAPCVITTPLTASVTNGIESIFCGTTIASLSLPITAKKVTLASEYEFLVENSGDSYSQSIVNNSFIFSFSQLNGIIPGRTYSVRVRTRVAGNWSNYGDACSISTPNLPPLPLPRLMTVSNESKQPSETIRKTDISSLNISNILTPNGDGKNDFWVIEQIDQYPANTVRIVDSKGRLVYTKKGYDNTWNGTFNGTQLAEGTYYYTIDFGNNLIKQGFVTIVW